MLKPNKNLSTAQQRALHVLNEYAPYLAGNYHRAGFKTAYETAQVLVGKSEQPEIDHAAARIVAFYLDE